MRDIPLRAVDTRGAPDGATFRRHLSVLSLPARTLALLTPVETASPASDRATNVIATELANLVDDLARGHPDVGSYLRAVGRLVGLGPGLTPTGDDLLIALAATCRRLTTGDSGVLSATTAQKFYAAVAAVPPGLTTGVAQHLLMASATGRFPEPLAAFVTSLGDAHADDGEVASLARTMAATGAHSGADWLAGVVALTRACVASEGERC